MKKKIVIGITGASGALYAKLLIEKLNILHNQIEDCCVIFSDNGKSVWEYELGKESLNAIPFKIFLNNDFYAAPASGSANYTHMIICPCSMGTIGKIASGTSDNLLVRSADVMLKEQKRLILISRESPLNLIHIENMKKLVLAGAIICPASPSFYSKPKNISELLETVVDRALILMDFDINSFKWGS